MSQNCEKKLSDGLRLASPRSGPAAVEDACSAVVRSTPQIRKRQMLEARFRGPSRLASMYMECQSVYMALRHKHLKIDQRKLDRAKRILKLATEQETIDHALDAVLAEEEILRAHRKVRAVGGMVDAFAASK